MPQDRLGTRRNEQKQWFRTRWLALNILALIPQQAQALRELTQVADLIGGFNSSGKYDFVSWDDDSQYMEKTENLPNHQLATDII